PGSFATKITKVTSSSCLVFCLSKTVWRIYSDYLFLLRKQPFLPVVVSLKDFPIWMGSIPHKKVRLGRGFRMRFEALKWIDLWILVFSFYISFQNMLSLESRFDYQESGFLILRDYECFRSVLCVPLFQIVDGPLFLRGKIHD